MAIETFGKTDKGVSEYSMVGDIQRACKFQSGSAGELASISLYIRYRYDANIKCAIYDSSYNLLANGKTEEKAILSDWDGFITFNFGANKPSVVAATDYWLAWFASVGGEYGYYSPGSTDQYITSAAKNYNDWDDPLVSAGGAAVAFSIYATYEEGNQAPTAPTSLLCEGEETPTEVTNLVPKFSAIYNDPDIGDQANALQIQIGTTPANNDMWDSGWIADLTQEGQRCSDQSYLGLPLLLKGTKYYWRIRFRDDAAEGAWSENAEFTMYESLVPIAPTDLKITAPLCFAACFNDPDSASSSAYEVHISSSLDLLDVPDIWDSGWQAESTIEGDICTPHLYAGSPLTFGEKYYWRIRFKDESGNTGLWSHPCWFIFRESD